jgi:hypothetical protein
MVECHDVRWCACVADGWHGCFWWKLMEFLNLDCYQFLVGGVSLYGFAVWAPDGGVVSVEQESDSVSLDRAILLCLECS